jgi:cell wall-associated NlpC family hydrolase
MSNFRLFASCLVGSCLMALPALAEDSAATIRHRIARGQSLAKIALLYHVPREAVVAANSDLTPERIPVGAVIQVPQPSEGWRVYQAQLDDTLDSVAKANNLDLDVIRNLNPQLPLYDPSRNLNQVAIKLPPLVTAEAPANLAPAPATPDDTVATSQPTTTSIPAIPLAPMPETPTAPPVKESRSGWVEVRLADGSKAWAPRASLMTYSKRQMAPNEVVSVGQRYYGAPYVWGGQTPNGVDCSGFVQQVFAMSGYSIPRLADDQYAACQPVGDDIAQPGDLVFFTTYLPGPSHVGIYLGQRKFLHASSSRGVVESSLEESYYKERFLGIRRIAPWSANLATSPSKGEAASTATAKVPAAQLSEQAGLEKP